MGIIFSMIGTLFVRVKEGGNVQAALNLGNWSSVVLTAIASYFLINWMLPETLSLRGFEFTCMGVFLGRYCGFSGGYFNEYYHRILYRHGQTPG